MRSCEPPSASHHVSAAGPHSGRKRLTAARTVVVALHAAAPGSLSLATDLRSGKPAEAGPALRAYGIGAQILAALGIHDMILLSNTRHSPVGLSAYGLAIVEERCITSSEK